MDNEFLEQIVILTITFAIGTFLYISKTSFIKKGDLIAEYSSQSSIPGGRRLKPVYTSLAGEIKFESLSTKFIKF